MKGPSRAIVYWVAWLVSATLGVASCDGGDAAERTDPLMDVFHRQAEEEGLTRIQTDGKRVFTHYCVTCHGELGEGDGQNAYNLDPAPPNFRESLHARPSSYWREIVSGGTAAVGRSALCPPRGHTLTSEDLDGLLAYLEVLGSGSDSPPVSDPP